MYLTKYSTYDRTRMKAYTLPVSYVVYDLETSDLFEDKNGKPIEGSQIVEFGAVKVIDGVVVETFNRRCSIEGHMSPGATKVNKITDAMLLGEPPHDEVFKQFLTFVDGLPLIGYNNNNFDDKFLDREAGRLGLEVPSERRDVRIDLHGSAKNHFALKDDCRLYGVANKNPHKGLSDALATQELFEKMKTEWRDNSTDCRDVYVEPKTKELAGEIICFTGTTNLHPKRPCMDIARAHGAELTNAVVQHDTPINKRPTLVVYLDEREGEAITLADEYGIKVLSGNDFLESVRYPTNRPIRYIAAVHSFAAFDFSDKKFSFANSLTTLDPFEGYQLVAERGGIGLGAKANGTSSRQADFLVVTDDLVLGARRASYVDNAISRGTSVIGESDFWDMMHIELAAKDIADHWVIVDDALDGGKIDVSNQPAWDGTVAPYKLFIQHGTAKSTHAGGWKIVACGFLTDEETNDEPHYGSAISVKKDAIQWTSWGNPMLGGDFCGVGANIGKVIVRDRYAPKSCKFLFDGLQRCVEFDLSGLDTSEATDMRGMFRGCSSVKYFMTTDRFKTSNVTDMSEMFFGCINAQVINCIGWDLSKVTTMYMMFENSPAAVLFDDANVPVPEHIDTTRMFDTTPKSGKWLRRI